MKLDLSSTVDMLLLRCAPNPPALSRQFPHPLDLEDWISHDRPLAELGFEKMVS